MSLFYNIYSILIISGVFCLKGPVFIVKVINALITYLLYLPFLKYAICSGSGNYINEYFVRYIEISHFIQLK